MCLPLEMGILAQLCFGGVRCCPYTGCVHGGKRELIVYRGELGPGFTLRCSGENAVPDVAQGHVAGCEDLSVCAENSQVMAEQPAALLNYCPGLGS